MKKAIIKGMCCQGCAREVKHILENLYGITNVEVFCDEGYAVFDGYVSKKVIQNSLADAGYQLVEIESL